MTNVFGRTLSRAIREVYDYLGSVLAISALVMLVAFPLGLGAGTAALVAQGPRGVELARTLWRVGAASEPAGTGTAGRAEEAPFGRARGSRLAARSSEPGGEGAGPRARDHASRGAPVGAASHEPRAASAPEALPLAVSFVVASIVCWTLLGPLLAGAAGLARQIVAREDPALGDLLREARRYALPGLALAAVQSIVAQILLVDLVFFLSLPSLGLRLVATLFLYAGLYWGLTLGFQWPLLVEGAGSVQAVVRKSALLVLDNFPASLGLGIFTLIFSVLCAVTGIGLVLLWAGVLSFVYTVALRELLRKYGLLSEARS